MKVRVYMHTPRRMLFGFDVFVDNVDVQSWESMEKLALSLFPTCRLDSWEVEVQE